MLHIFRLNGRAGAYDCTARTYIPLSALALKLAEAVTPPLAKDCPSALRYAFAKYDSHDLNEAYSELYALYAREASHDKAADAAPAPGLPYRECSADTAAEAAALLHESDTKDGEAIVLTVAYASPAEAAALTKNASVPLMLIAGVPDKSLTKDGIALLNETGVYVQAPPEAVPEYAARGLRYLSAALPATDEGAKYAARIARIAEKSRAAGQPAEFAPFTLALRAREDHDPHRSGCADCWAREICGGKCLSDSGVQTDACALERTLIECAVLLSAPAENEDED